MKTTIFALIALLMLSTIAVTAADNFGADQRSISAIEGVTKNLFPKEIDKQLEKLEKEEAKVYDEIHDDMKELKSIQKELTGINKDYSGDVIAAYNKIVKSKQSEVEKSISEALGLTAEAKKNLVNNLINQDRDVEELAEDVQNYQKKSIEKFNLMVKLLDKKLKKYLDLGNSIIELRVKLQKANKEALNAIVDVVSEKVLVKVADEFNEKPEKSSLQSEVEKLKAENAKLKEQLKKPADKKKEVKPKKSAKKGKTTIYNKKVSIELIGG